DAGTPGGTGRASADFPYAGARVQPDRPMFAVRPDLRHRAAAPPTSCHLSGGPAGRTEPECGGRTLRRHHQQSTQRAAPGRGALRTGIVGQLDRTAAGAQFLSETTTDHDGRVWLDGGAGGILRLLSLISII